MTDTFSTPAEHAFEHDEINDVIAGPSTMGDATEELSLEEAFEVEDTIRRIREGGYKTVSDIGVLYSSQNRWLLGFKRLLDIPDKGRSACNSRTSYCPIRSRCFELYKRV